MTVNVWESSSSIQTEPCPAATRRGPPGTRTCATSRPEPGSTTATEFGAAPASPGWSDVPVRQQDHGRRAHRRPRSTRRRPRSRRSAAAAARPAASTARRVPGPARGSPAGAPGAVARARARARRAASGVHRRTPRARPPAARSDRARGRAGPAAAPAGGARRTSCSSSGTSSAWRPRASSASIRSSTAPRRSSSSRAISGWRERLVRELRQGRSAPERERLPEAIGGRGGVAGAEAEPPVLDECGELVDVTGARGDAEDVARPLRHERLVAVRVEDAAERRDGVLDDLAGGLRRVPVPQLLDDPVARHDLVRVHEQQRQERARSTRRERYRPCCPGHLDRPEEAVLHRCSSVRVRR